MHLSQQMSFFNGFKNGEHLQYCSSLIGVCRVIVNGLNMKELYYYNPVYKKAVQSVHICSTFVFVSHMLYEN